MINKSKNNIINDKFDQNSYNSIFQKIDKLQNLNDQGLEKLTTFDKLLEDFYYSVYKYLPKLQDEQKVQYEYLGNREFINICHKLPEFQKLRTFTKLDPSKSAFATIFLGNKILQEMSKEFKKLNEQIKETQQYNQQLQKINRQLQGLSQAIKKSKSQGQKQKLKNIQNNLKTQGQQLKNKIRQSINKMKQMQQNQQKKIQKVLQKNMNKAIDQQQQLNQLLSWGSAPGQLQKINISQKFDLLLKIINNSKLQKIAKLLGKLKFLAASKYRDSTKMSKSEIHNIEQGNNISRIIPSELLRLTNPKLKLLFYKDFIEKQLLQYSLKGKEKIGRGNIICCIDVSGSMQGDPEVWAKATALALLEIAYRQKRDLIIMIFDTKIELEIRITKDDPEKLEKFIKIAETATWGGTSFRPPLERSIVELVKQEGKKKSDIVFITDGICHISEEFYKKFNEFKKEQKVKVISVLIQQSDDSELQKFSDRIYKISYSDLKDELSGQIFEEVL